MSASRRNKLLPYTIKTGGATGWRSPELDGGFRHNRYRYSNSDCGRLLGSTPAIRRYKVRPSGIKAQDFAGFCGGGTGTNLAEFLLDG